MQCGPCGRSQRTVPNVMARQPYSLDTFDCLLMLTPILDAFVLRYQSMTSMHLPDQPLPSSPFLGFQPSRLPLETSVSRIQCN